MANTRNGYPVRKTRSSLVRRPGPHTYNGEAGYRYFHDNDTADILADAMWQWHTRIGLVRLWGGWRSPSYNDEVNGNFASNHMSATATDTNWDKHPYERNFPGGGYHHGFTDAQLAQLRQILRLYRDDTNRSIVRSGMDYAPGWVDAMHLETGMYTTGRGTWTLVPRSKIRQVANKVRARHRPPRTFAEIKTYQRKVGVTADGKHGPATISAIRRYQRDRNIPQTGLWDEATKNVKEEDPPMSAAEVKEIKDHIDILRRERTNAHVKEMEAIKQVASDVLRYKNEQLAGDRDVYALLREAAASNGGENEATVEQVVQAIFARGSQGFSADYWMREGQVDADHRAFPGDKYSKTDLLLRIAEAVGVESYGVYTASEGPVALQKRGDAFVRKSHSTQTNEE